MVRDLTEDFQGKWHRVYFDNFFTSKTLLCQLKHVQIYGCGTARLDPSRPQETEINHQVIITNITCRSHRGEIVTRQAGSVCASAWMDRKLVTVMYTGVDPTEHGNVLRWLKDSTRKSFPSPAATIAYNQHMGGVDVGDQLRGYYHVRMKCRKFYKYVANFLLDTAITNAFIPYRMTNPGTKLKIVKFREVLAKQLTVAVAGLDGPVK